MVAGRQGRGYPSVRIIKPAPIWRLAIMPPKPPSLSIIPLPSKGERRAGAYDRGALRRLRGVPEGLSERRRRTAGGLARATGRPLQVQDRDSLAGPLLAVPLGRVSQENPQRSRAHRLRLRFRRGQSVRLGNARHPDLPSRARRPVADDLALLPRRRQADPGEVPGPRRPHPSARAPARDHGARREEEALAGAQDRRG